MRPLHHYHYHHPPLDTQTHLPSPLSPSSFTLASLSCIHYRHKEPLANLPKQISHLRDGCLQAQGSRQHSGPLRYSRYRHRHPGRECPLHVFVTPKYLQYSADTNIYSAAHTETETPYTHEYGAGISDGMLLPHLSLTYYTY